MLNKYINKYKPVYKSYTLNNKHYFKIDNININNGISYLFNLSELDKLHKTYTPLKLFIEYDVIATYNLFTRWFHVCNRTLISINLFDIYDFLNKDIHKVKLAYASDSNDELYFFHYK